MTIATRFVGWLRHKKAKSDAKLLGHHDHNQHGKQERAKDNPNIAKGAAGVNHYDRTGRGR